MRPFIVLLFIFFDCNVYAGSDIYKDNTIIHNEIRFNGPLTEVDSHGTLEISNKNLNFTSQNIEVKFNNKNQKKVTIHTSGFNKKDNSVHLDKKGIIPYIGHINLPGGIISAMKISDDGKTAYYISRWDDFYIVDISNIKKPKTLSKLNHININGDFLLSKNEKKLYLNTKNVLIIYDISNLKKPKIIKHISSKN